MCSIQRLDFCCRIMGCLPMLSTGAREVQGCTRLASRPSGLACGRPAVTSESKSEKDRKDHEHHGSAEHPAWQILVHDPAKQQRTDDAAEIEAGGDDAEGPPRSARRCCVADQHIA